MQLSGNLLERRDQRHIGAERTKKKGLSVLLIGGQSMEMSGQLQRQRSVNIVFKFFFGN